MIDSAFLEKVFTQAREIVFDSTFSPVFAFSFALFILCSIVRLLCRCLLCELPSKDIGPPFADSGIESIKESTLSKDVSWQQ